MSVKPSEMFAVACSPVQRKYAVLDKHGSPASTIACTYPNYIVQLSGIRTNNYSTDEQVLSLRYEIELSNQVGVWMDDKKANEANNLSGILKAHDLFRMPGFMLSRQNLT